MEQLNRIELRGIVGNVKPQEISGRKVYRFTLATSRAYKDKNGVAVIDTTWHNVVAWENRNVDLSKLEKGTKLYVSGRVRASKFTSSVDDTEKTVYEVVASRVVFVDGEEPMSYEM